MHECMRSSGGTCGSLVVSGTHGQGHELMHDVGVGVFPINESPCMCEGHAPRSGLFWAQLIATERNWRKQEKGLRVSSSIESISLAELRVPLFNLHTNPRRDESRV